LRARNRKNYTPTSQLSQIQTTNTPLLGYPTSNFSGPPIGQPKDPNSFNRFVNYEEEPIKRDNKKFDSDENFKEIAKGMSPFSDQISKANDVQGYKETYDKLINDY